MASLRAETEMVTAVSIVTLPTVRNRSGTVSTAMNSPKASIGTPIAIATGDLSALLGRLAVAEEAVLRQDRAHVPVPVRTIGDRRAAGGHLAAELASTNWHSAGLPTDAIKGLCGVSGLYDLEPIRLCYLNETLQLDGPQVQQYSPLHHLPATKMPVILTAGGAESAEFHRQKNAYALALHGAGFPVQQVKLADGHPLDVIDKLADGSSELAQAIIAMASK